MSHTTTLKGVTIKDTNALASAVVDLKSKGVNCELLTNTKPRMYYNNQHGVCAFVLRLADGQLLQNYAKHAAINSAAMAGHMVESCDYDAEGNINLVLAVA